MIDVMETRGFSRRELHPHGGHLINLHIAAGLELGGCEAYPGVFQPFGGYPDRCGVGVLPVAGRCRGTILGGLGGASLQRFLRLDGGIGGGDGGVATLADHPALLLGRGDAHEQFATLAALRPW